jgi:predicted DsbA family dithiol-disulfide isomerase
VTGSTQQRAGSIEVAAGTIVVFADLACPWAHVAVHRLHRTRAKLSLEGRVHFDVRAFPLELVNGRSTPKRVLDAEIPVAGTVEPDAGWQVWQRRESEYPVTMLLALEAVLAAKEQSPGASEELDRALRRAFFAESRCISLLTVILAAAAACPGVDEDRLAGALASGRARPELMAQADVAKSGAVAGSPHLFLPDGRDWPNPGIELHWSGEQGRGFPIIDRDDPQIYESLLTSAAS